jgi:hypothetical protein
MARAHACGPFGLAAAALFAASAAVVSGCASTRLDAAWSDPEFAGRSLRGAKVLVVCGASEEVVARICQDKLVAQVAAAGASPVPARENLPTGPSDRTLAAARGAGATAIFGSSIAQGSPAVGFGPTVGVGVGGGSGGGYGGVGISFPIGGGGAQRDAGYAADVLVTDVATGRLMWTSKVSTGSWQSLDTAVGELIQTAVEGARQAGLF